MTACAAVRDSGEGQSEKKQPCSPVIEETHPSTLLLQNVQRGGRLVCVVFFCVPVSETS